MISYKVKGIILAVIISLASIMMPFSVYASTQSQIVPTFSSTTTQWNTHLSVTNFSDGTNNQASSTLSFTFDDDYYGMIYFDGYGPSNQHIANYAVCYVAGGYGEWRYSYYQNGLINITSVTIQIVNVVKPQSSVDLTQIITLLTAIENDTSSIDNVLDTTLAQIRLVLAELIESNGYLETLTELRQWNFPIESLNFVYMLMKNNVPIVDMIADNYYNYPVFELSNGMDLTNGVNISADKFILIFGFSRYMNKSNFTNFFTYSSSYELSDFIAMTPNTRIQFYKAIFTKTVTGNQAFTLSYNYNQVSQIVPIYFKRGYDELYNSTDFALVWGLSNQLLDDLHIIANGTTSSNSAASDLDDASDDYSSIADDVVNVENGLTTNFETEVNKIDLNTGLNVFGGHFLTSATWVRTQFDRLTENTPYGAMVVYGLTLGFALLMLGKVFL